MLILRRRAGEALIVGGNIKITVLDTSDGAVRLAIEAPREIPVLRGELLQAANANRDAASESSTPQELLAMLDGKKSEGGPDKGKEAMDNGG